MHVNQKRVMISMNGMGIVVRRRWIVSDVIRRKVGWLVGSWMKLGTAIRARDDRRRNRLGACVRRGLLLCFLLRFGLSGGEGLLHAKQALSNGSDRLHHFSRCDLRRQRLRLRERLHRRLQPRGQRLDLELQAVRRALLGLLPRRTLEQGHADAEVVEVQAEHFCHIHVLLPAQGGEAASSFTTLCNTTREVGKHICIWTLM